MSARQYGERKLDLGTVGGVMLALAAILGGYVLEHGQLSGLLGLSAALIVLGGSLGATLVANPVSLVKRTVAMTRELLTERVDDTPALIERIVDLSLKSRKNGIVSLEDEMGDGVDPFLKKALTMAIDGMELHEIRAVMDLDMDLSERRLEAAAGVYESAGGFAPTIGIIGAVLGLITVMGDLGDMSKVGKGIAGAFVATIYGVGAANVLFLPAGHKLRMRAVTGRDRQELIVEGVCGIAEGLNPKLIRSKLEAYLPTAANTRTGRGSETSRRRAA